MKTKADLLKQIESLRSDIELTEARIIRMGLWDEEVEEAHLQNEVNYLSNKLSDLCALEHIGAK